MYKDLKELYKEKETIITQLYIEVTKNSDNLTV